MCYPSRETSIDDFLMEMVSMFHSKERGMKTMSDPDWLEIVGHPTIPTVQSLRQPPAHVAAHVRQENMMGITNKAASQRYLQKLKRDRERNQEVLSECVDNLPIVISSYYTSMTSGRSRHPVIYQYGTPTTATI